MRRKLDNPSRGEPKRRSCSAKRIARAVRCLLAALLGLVLILCKTVFIEKCSVCKWDCLTWVAVSLFIMLFAAAGFFGACDEP
jgi:hypothetical protein